MSLLPLFPLDLVLLPGSLLPLHIFEPRYREMTAECIAEKKPFGIVRSKDENTVDIGCTAEILTVAKQYPDGRSDIVTRGGRRFEILQLNQERPFLQAEVFFLEDEPDAATPTEMRRARSLYTDLMTLAGAKADLDPATAREQMSFQLVSSLPIDLDFKQSLLTMRSEQQRLRAVISYFESILPSIKRQVQAQHKAGGNGHVM